jgi:hypothetical protein
VFPFLGYSLFHLGLGEKVFSECSSIVSHSKSHEGPT